MTSVPAVHRPDPTTLETELTDELERLRWRRRESNPRPRTHRESVYKRSPRFDFDRRPEADALPTA